MEESFVCKIQRQNRIAIPLLVTELMKLQKGDKLRVTIEKLR